MPDRSEWAGIGTSILLVVWVELDVQMIRTPSIAVDTLPRSMVVSLARFRRGPTR